LDSTGSGQGPVAGCCECSDEPSGSCATELVSYPDIRLEGLSKIKKNLSQGRHSPGRDLNRAHLNTKQDC
jgi:hypothetical protein